MRVIELSKENEFGILAEAVQVLKRGGIVTAPSDTVYGLYGDATSTETIKKIFTLKARSEKNPLSVFVGSFEMLDEVAYIKNDKIKKFLKRVWPGKITSVLPARGWMPIEIRGGGGLTVGVRMPNYPFINLFIKSFGKPTTSTSANISGKGSYTDIDDVLNDFNKMPFKPDLVISAGALPKSKPSTVVEFADGEIKILREGAVSREEIKKIWEGVD